MASVVPGALRLKGDTRKDRKKDKKHKHKSKKTKARRSASASSSESGDRKRARGASGDGGDDETERKRRKLNTDETPRESDGHSSAAAAEPFDEFAGMTPAELAFAKKKRERVRACLQPGCC